MPQTYQTPGVYIVEQNAFPNSVVEVATAIPAFIGYTAKAIYKGRPLKLVPTRVESLKEFVDRFGAGFAQVFDLVTVPPASSGTVAAAGTPPATSAAPEGGITGGTLVSGDTTKPDVSDASQPITLDITNATITGAVVTGAPNKADITGATLTQVTITGATISNGKISGNNITITGSGQTKGGTIPNKGNSGNSGKKATLPPTTISFDSGTQATLTPQGTSLFYLYNAIQLFYLNGGGPCYIVSIGDNQDAENSSPQDFIKAIATLEAEQDPTMLLCPDALMLNSNDYASVMQGMLTHCALVQKRVALFDVYGGTSAAANSPATSKSATDSATNGTSPATPAANPGTPPTLDDIDAFREAVQDNLKYGIAYFPWMNTTVVSASDLTFDSLSSDALGALASLLPGAGTGTTTNLASSATGVQPVAGQPVAGQPVAGQSVAGQSVAGQSVAGQSVAGQSVAGQSVAGQSVAGQKAADPAAVLLQKQQDLFKQAQGMLASSTSSAPAGDGKGAATQNLDAAKVTTPPPTADEIAAKKLALHNALKVSSPEYAMTIHAIATYLNVLPVAPAMAGVYTTVDANRGVWKAPANVGLNSVVAPNVLVSDMDQAGLNVDAVTGKSINVIRSFKGLGTLVWGARTLDGNSQDWRYINVRRTMIMIEQSIKLAARNTVFEPNDANTWVTFKSMLNSFLFNLWKQGALFGTKPDDAYQVLVGLGTTMTTDDILDGIMNVTVLVALVRPAEFIVVTFKQQMQQAA